MTDTGFYRVGPDGQLEHAVNGIATPTGSYAVADAALHSYPLPGGWRYFTSEAAALTALSAPDPTAVPASVSPYQARRALLAAGLLDDVEAAVAAADPTVKIAWEYGILVNRASPFIASMQLAIGLTDSDVDDLFRAAAAIV